MKRLRVPILLALGLGAFLTAPPVRAALRLPHIFGDNMVIQRDQPIYVWGWAKPGAGVRVQFGPRDLTVRADAQGRWSMELDPLPACSLARSLTVSSDGETIEYDGVLVGDVWLLGGQSNMEDELRNIYHGDMETASAHYPAIRLMTIPQVATPQPRADFERVNEFNAWAHRYERKGWWFQCTPRAASRFSAIGYVFGRRLHLVTGAPIGLIDASWGGTTIEAWTSRKALEAIPEARPLLQEWDERIAAYDPQASLRARVERWKKEAERRKQAGQPPRPKPTEPEPDPAGDRNNPGAAFNGMIAPFAGFRIKGVIFNQGYNNALGDSRPRLYAKVFQAMIRDWRRAFRNEAMPFGIIELTAGGEPQTYENFERSMVDPAPFIREAQFKTWQALDHVGFAPAYDQQVPWYHPHKKLLLGERMARWALHDYYGYEELGWQPAVCVKWEKQDDHFILAFDRAVRAHDGRPFEGFAIAGADRHFYPARAEFLVVGKDERGRDRRDESRLKVWSPLVKEPAAVRYAWARNPLGNAVNGSHYERIIPICSFRTDNWDWPEAPFKSEGQEAVNAHRRKISEMRRQAAAWAKQRAVEEAQLVLEKTGAK